MRYGIENCLFYKKDINGLISGILTVEEVNKINDNSEYSYVKAGYSIFKEGDKPKGLIYLVSGSAKVFKYESGKREQIVRLARNSSFVGYKALFADKLHTTFAAAIEDCELLIIPTDILFDIMSTNFSFSRFIIKALASEIGFNFQRILNLTQKKLPSRLAETILLLSELYGFEPDSTTLNIKITKENIGFISNMTTANAIRTLKEFERQGLLKIVTKKIRLLDISAIEKIANDF